MILWRMEQGFASAILAVLLALFIRAFLFELARVKGTSMKDTLENREVMLVSKIRYTTLWLRLPFQSRQKKEACPKWVLGGVPKRFDVVICRYPHRGDTNFVKRVVGLPGECVELREGVLYVDGERQEEPYVSAAYRGGFLSDFGPVTVPDDSFFVLGDHRNVSNDSRRVGAVRRAWITGKVLAVLFPFRLARRIR